MVECKRCGHEFIPPGDTGYCSVCLVIKFKRLKKEAAHLKDELKKKDKELLEISQNYVDLFRELKPKRAKELESLYHKIAEIADGSHSQKEELTEKQKAEISEKHEAHLREIYKD